MQSLKGRLEVQLGKQKLHYILFLLVLSFPSAHEISTTLVPIYLTEYNQLHFSTSNHCIRGLWFNLKNKKSNVLLLLVFIETQPHYTHSSSLHIPGQELSAKGSILHLSITLIFLTAAFTI